MGKIRIKTIGEEKVEKQEKIDAQKRAEVKKLKKPTKVKPVGGKGGERMKQVEVSDEEIKKMEQAESITSGAPAKSEKKATKKTVQAKTISKKHNKAQKLIDSSKKYPLDEAIKLLKKTSYARFDETVEIHFNLQETGLKGEVSLPHGIGKELRVVVADDKVLDKIEQGTIDFDVLIASPSFMPRLVKFAKVLGPKGLMPNPKTGKISDKPEEAAKKFKGGALRYTSEAKYPLLHQAVGKLSFADKNLIENIESLMNAVGVKNIKNAYLSATMSPSIQLSIVGSS